MPKLTVAGYDPVEIEHGKRMVLALEEDVHIDQLHACGGNARCTTCRVEFIAGEPPMTTAAEKHVLNARGLTGVRLSCQIVCDHDMAVRCRHMRIRRTDSVSGQGYWRRRRADFPPVS